VTYGERSDREDEFSGQIYPNYRPTSDQDATSGDSGASWTEPTGPRSTGDSGSWESGSWSKGSWDTRDTGSWDSQATVSWDPRESGSWHTGSWEQDLRRVDPADEEPDRRRGSRKRRGMPLWQELPLLLIVAFCLAVLIRTFLLQAFYIPSGSMENTLLVGDRVLVNKVVYDMRDPARGEVVVFRGTDAWAPENTPDPDIGFFAKLGRTVGDLVGISRPGEKDFIKRVIGLPGDRVSCCDVKGRVFVNGQPLDEPYVTENSQLETPPNAKECVSRRFDEVLVEPGQIFVMGDHRLVSQDSRCQGQVPIENVIGRAFVIVWPSGRWASLSVPPTFENVPAPFAAGEQARLTPELRAATGEAAASGEAATYGGAAASDAAAASGGPPGGLGVLAPLLLSLLLPARSRLSMQARRRRLPG
jgi:signal peptidase I